VIKMVVTLLLGAALAVVACSSDDDVPAPAAAPTETAVVAELFSLTQDVVMSIELTSTVFNRIRRIPIEYVCRMNKTNPNVPGGVQSGGNQSPPLAWTGVPEGTVSFALIVEGDEPRIEETQVHWLIWNIPGDATELAAAVPTTTQVASIGPRTAQGTNGYDRVGYDGPCPVAINLDAQAGNQTKIRGGARDAASRYTFRIYALDIELDLGSDTTHEDLMRAIDGHVLAGGEVVGERVGEYFRRIVGS